MRYKSEFGLALFKKKIGGKQKELLNSCNWFKNLFFLKIF